MHRSRLFWHRYALMGTSGLLLPFAFLGTAAEPAKQGTLIPPPAIQLVQDKDQEKLADKPPKTAPKMPPMVEPPPAAPTDPARPDVQTPGTGTGARLSTPLSGPGVSADQVGLGDDQRSALQGGAPNLVVPGTSAVGRATTDAGDLLARAAGSSGIGTQRRSPIATEARIRGLRLAEIATHSDGAFWFPARLDLDTFLSKIDSGIVENIVVLKGPYSARYGPGFAFIDIATEHTPRYQNGFEWHGRTLTTYKHNGEQLYGRQALWGGDSDWGFRLSYGHRTGNDYTTGAGIELPSSYNARDVDFVYGYDFSPVSRIEIGYMRLDQTGLEFPGQVFDTRFLVTDGVRLRYTLEKQEFFDRFIFDTWYNYTRLAGDAQGSGKRRQIPSLSRAGFVGFTDIDLGSLGYRAAMTWGEDKHPQLTVGTDFRRLNGHLNEFDTLFSVAIPCGSTTNFPVPRSHQGVLGGAFVEYVHPFSEQFVVKMGARGDYVNTNIDGIPPGFDCVTFNRRLDATTGPTDDYDRQFGLWLSYLTSEYKLTRHWTVVSGLGHAERPPTTTELYALQPFLAILQQGFTTVQGNARLNPERLWQVDFGLRGNYEGFRTGFNTFASFIEDYITYQVESPAQGSVKNLATLDPRALTVRFVNTDLASLVGFEMYGEFDYTDYLTPFITMSYVEGRDHSRARRGVALAGRPGIGGAGANQEPLAGIPPFETRIGLRFHDSRPVQRWGLELSGRFVASQHRVASSLDEQVTSGFAVYDVRSFWQARQGLLLTAGVENVFDRNYREHLDLRTGQNLGGPGVFQPGINGYVGVEMRY